MRKTLRERFESKLVPGENGCIEWVGFSNLTGYGRISAAGKMQLAHRVAWLLHHGSMPTLHVLHKCDNPSCCNIKHLFLGTNADNVADRDMKGRSKQVVDAVMVIFMKELQMQDLNQTQIGECLGIRQSTVSNYLSGRKVVND